EPFGIERPQVRLGCRTEVDLALLAPTQCMVAPWADNQLRVPLREKITPPGRNRLVQVDRPVAVVVPAADVEIGNERAGGVFLELPRITPRLTEPGLYERRLATKKVFRQVLPGKRLQQCFAGPGVPELFGVWGGVGLAPSHFAAQIRANGPLPPPE